MGPDAIPGLTKDVVKAEVDAGLKRAGIILSPGGGADLVVTATAFVAEADRCFVTVKGRLVEPAKLDRNGFAVDAVSWESGGTTIMKADGCAKATTELVRSAIADFAEHYRAMNPTKG